MSDIRVGLYSERTLNVDALPPAVTMKRKKTPKFESEAEERRFWQEHDSSEYLDWSSAKDVLMPKLKPSTRTISVRLPESMLDALRSLANKRDIPYQSLLKVFLAERIEAEFRTESK